MATVPAAEIVTSQELYEHVHELADDLDVPVWSCLNCENEPRPQGAALLPTRRDDPRGLVVLSGLPDRVPMYLIALHELGHRADPMFDRRLALDREVFAWRWALEQSLVDPGPAGWATILLGLQSYTRDRRYKQTPAFLTLLEEARTKCA